jgi:hypothetical protein
MVKKTKRYDGGGEIVVTGNRPTGPATLGSLGGYNLNPAVNASVQKAGPFSTSGSSPVRSGSTQDQRLTPLIPPGSTAAIRSRFTPAVVTQPQSALGNIVGAVAPKGYGATGRFTLAKGGAVKKAKGGSVSSASKRADGCATKGKTKGKFV